ncbi:hypothetical protein ACWDSL_18505 [Streptomyces sp. NPDC000941]
MINRRTFGKALGTGAAAASLTGPLGLPAASAATPNAATPHQAATAAVPGTHSAFTRLLHGRRDLTPLRVDQLRDGRPSMGSPDLLHARQ